MKPGYIVWMMVMLIMAGAAMGYDYNIELSRSELPYYGNIQVSPGLAAGANLSITYGEFLSGPAFLELDGSPGQSINTSVHVPFETTIAAQTSYVNISVMNGSDVTSSESYSVRFTIDDDIVFGLETEKSYCFAGEPYAIVITSPENSSLEMTIEGTDGSKSYPVLTNRTTRIMYTPKSSGHYTINASVSFRNISESFMKNFTVYNMLSCTIDASNKALVNQSIRLTPVLGGGIGKKIYSWEFGDSSHSDTESPMHKYKSSGSYRVRLSIKDEKNYRTTCYKDITIENRKYTLIVELKDNRTGGAVGDANVSLAGMVKKSNVHGKASFFDVEAGDYTLKVIKDDYDDVSKKVHISGDKTIVLNISQTPEEKKPVPKIDILYPENNLSISRDSITVEFNARSKTPINSCMLLLNDEKLLGYKVRGRINEPKSEKVYDMQMNLSNGRFKWRIMCENNYGEGASEERLIEVSGIEEKEIVASQADNKSEEQQEESEKKDTDLSEFDSLISHISSFRNEVGASGSAVKEAFDVLGYDKLLREQESQLKKLRQEMKDLGGLSVSDADRKKKKSEIMSDLDGIKSKMPKEIKINAQSRYVVSSGEDDIKNAVDEYLKWKNYSLSSGAYNRYVKRVTDAQGLMNITAYAITTEVTYMDGKAEEFGIMSKEADISDDVTGGLFLELVPKPVAGSIDKLSFSVPYELVNRDPVVSIYTAENNRFSYYVRGHIPIEELKSSASVVVLDLNHPENRITGLAVLGFGSGSGKLLFALLLLSVVLAGNYVIFFRDRDSRKRFISGLKSMKDNLTPRSGRDRLISMLDSVIDMLNSDQTMQALAHYPGIISLYESMDESFRAELEPVMAHLHYELELYNLNKMINEACDRLSRGDSSVGDSSVPDEMLKDIADTMDELPEYYKKRISSRMRNLSVSIEIQKLRKQDGLSVNGSAQYSGESIIEDSLFGVKR